MRTSNSQTTRPRGNASRPGQTVGQYALAARCSLLALLVGVTALSVGCGDGLPKRVPISGTVLLDGEPLPLGAIAFMPEGISPSSSKIGPDGSFDLNFQAGGKGAVLGTHRIQITAFDTSSGRRRSLVPRPYTDFRTSGLTHEVTEADDAVVIELSSSVNS